MSSPEQHHHHQPQESQNHDDSHLSVPQPPPPVHYQHQSQPAIDPPEGLPAFQRNLSFHKPTTDEQSQRGHNSLIPGSRSNNTLNTRSSPNSRATSRSRLSIKPVSKSGSRPVSWLISANSEYTSMYDNFGGSRSHRNSILGDDSFSNAEKGVRGRLSSRTSFVGDIGEHSSGEKSHHQSTATSEESTRPGIVGHSSCANALIREDSLDSEDTGSSDESRPTKGNVSAVKAGFLLIKAFVGTGILFLPRAFSRGGILFSCVTLALVALVCFFAFLLLVKVRLVIRENFQDMGGILYGKWMRLAVLLSVTLSQTGFVCAYLIFVSQNLDAVVQTFTKNKFHGIAQKYYILIPLVVLIPLVLIRRMSILSVPSMFANLFIIFGIVYLWYFSINSLVHHGAGPNITLFNKDEFALLIGTAVFSYEGIGLIIPITESMVEPEKFPRVLAITMTIVTLIFTSVGALCYAAFGSDVQTIVLLNLPTQGGMTVTVEILYSLAIILSVPLMLSPASRIVEQGIFGTRSGGLDTKVKMRKNLLRVVLICLCAILSFAIGGPNLDKFVSLVGSVACMPLCFIFPALFHYRACAKTVRARVIDVLLGLLGLAAMVFTLYITIRSWIVVTAPEARP
ncbi:neutral amino acid transporter [Podila verticillata]|nr:neutral amino acid transporter [Podila verticillata]KAI9239672.1 MAG: transmembrane amino acid transporter protein-domain-containing protein [Podila humilis]